MSGHPEENLATLLERGRSSKALRIKVARQDVNEFCELVLRDEETGNKITQAPIHEKWHALADQNPRLVIWSHTEAGKTSQLALGRTLHALGKNSAIRVAIIGNTREQSSKILLTIGKYIKDSEELHEVFPNLIPGDLWRANALYVKRDTPAKDPSVQAFGVHGAVLGSRIDLLILDDVLDYENTLTPRARNDLWEWYHSTVASRITAKGRVICVGNSWHPEDLMHRWENHPSWKTARFPVLDSKGNPTWFSRWPLTRIQEVRQERGPLEFARTMMCQARDDSDARFKRKWIDMALEAGDGWPVVHTLTTEIVEEDLKAYDAESRLGGEIRVYTGVDLAVQKHTAADKTALVSIMVMPNDDRRLLNVEAGRWSGPEIIQKIIDTHQRYDSIFVVESNAAQDYIRQFTLEHAAIPIIPYNTTARTKFSPQFGVESIAAEMANGKWIFPNTGGSVIKELDRLITEMLYYQPDAHTGDRLMAMWLSREGARLGHPASRRNVSARIIGSDRSRLH